MPRVGKIGVRGKPAAELLGQVADGLGGEGPIGAGVLEMGSRGELVVLPLPLMGHEVPRIEHERRLRAAEAGIVEAALEECVVTIRPARIDPGGPAPPQDLAPALGRRGDEPREECTVKKGIEVDVGDQQELARFGLPLGPHRRDSHEQDDQCGADRLGDTGNHERTPFIRP